MDFSHSLDKYWESVKCQGCGCCCECQGEKNFANGHNWAQKTKSHSWPLRRGQKWCRISGGGELLLEWKWRVPGEGSWRWGMREGFVEEVTSEMVLEKCTRLSYQRIRGLAFQVFWENRKGDSSRRCEERRWPGEFNRVNILRVLVSPWPLEGDAQRLFSCVQGHKKGLYVSNLIFQSLLIEFSTGIENRQLSLTT